jgi:hypothetical protein
MTPDYEARWVSKALADRLKRNESHGEAVLLDMLRGSILVGPAGSDLADGAILTAMEAEAELQDPWHLGPRTKLWKARRLLGLEARELAGFDA